MRYIRTKDGRIIKIGEQTDTGYAKGTLEIHNKAGIATSYEPFEILKQADTVEELCDEFIVVHKDGTHVFQKSTADDEVSKEYVEYLLRNNQTFYGAIWTDKGLIYVAKMNEKGELELL